MFELLSAGYKTERGFMKKEINFGIGFITGRPNICKIVNNYYKYLLEQVEKFVDKAGFSSAGIDNLEKEEKKKL